MYSSLSLVFFAHDPRSCSPPPRANPLTLYFVPLVNLYPFAGVVRPRPLLPWVGQRSRTCWRFASSVTPRSWWEKSGAAWCSRGWRCTQRAGTAILILQVVSVFVFSTRTHTYTHIYMHSRLAGCFDRVFQGVCWCSVLTFEYYIGLTCLCVCSSRWVVLCAPTFV